MTNSSYFKFSETHNTSSKLQYQNLSTERQQIFKDALRLLIHIFWSKDGKKDWVELIDWSKSIWMSLHRTPEFELDQTLQTINILLSDLSHDDLQIELESEFVRIFINTRGGVTASLYHSFYYDEQHLLMNEPAAEMTRLLEDIGMDTKSGMGEPPDHLCIELEYLLFLLEHIEPDPDPDLIKHIQVFASEFMLPWISKFQKSIPNYMPASFFCQTAQTMKQLLIIIGKID
ncbi:molecular chaperone TorD family protein [Desulfonatronovibrio magnus]|uniref:molecular chaperone TorD family protein n=1 Tax=Desulfonatronovibrio magnus TaxID=698827 RepID=UPI000697CF22|nr:molecular chaperone TorD family protein [Desulfonatronovibrio magnus]